PSATPPRGSELLTKNSMRYLTLGEADWFRVPTMVVPSAEIDVRTGEFWKLLGSLAAPWPWESLAVTPSSLGKTTPLLRSMPASKVALLRPFSKTELPRIELPLFWIGLALFGSGLPKTAIPAAPLNSTRLPRPLKLRFGLSPMTLPDTAG